MRGDPLATDQSQPTSHRYLAFYHLAPRTLPPPQFANVENDNYVVYTQPSQPVEAVVRTENELRNKIGDLALRN